MKFTTSLKGFAFLVVCCLSICRVSAKAQAEEPAEVWDDSEEEILLTNSTNGARDGRVFPFLAVVKLGNERCSSSMGDGVCKTKKQCESEGGVSSGSSCGNNYGVCCMISMSCSAKNNGNPVVVRNSGSHITQPSSYDPPFQCRFDIPRKSGYCQVRLDFVSFNLAPADINGDCSMDSMTITGADNVQNMIICGMNKDQHLYLHYGASDRISINMNLMTSGSVYDILVTQLKCSNNDSNKKNKRKGKKFTNSNNNNNDDEDNTVLIEPAPFGCTQYYTKASDIVKTMNYQKVPDIPNYGTSNPNANTNQLNNEMYTVCIKTLTGSNRITWTKCSPDDAFVLTGSPSDPAQNGILQSKTGSDCTTDYVDIPGSPAGRYCGTDFPTSVVSTAKPYSMYVYLDNTENPALTSPINPMTGCCVGCHCELYGSPVLGDGNDLDGAILPCQMNPEQFCVADQYLSDRTDSYNLGFCLSYLIS